MPSSSRFDVEGGTAGSPPKPPGDDPPPGLDGQPTVISHRPPWGVASNGEALITGGSDRVFPTRLGHIDLTEYVGGGGMGRVFRGYDKALARTVAVKILSPDQAADPEIVARFRNEAQSSARLNHENIVQVYLVGEEAGLPFIVFEFIEGMNVRTLVEQKRGLPLAEALGYTYQVARALAHAAACNVVHRDIKPSNILITKDGRVKLADMGLARVRKPPAPGGDLTASGVTLGTFDYIAPEQARDPRTADVRSDIYSLGCTLFYMLTGRPPFPEGTVLQKLLQHQGEKPPDVRQSRPDLPEGVPQLLRRMMAKDPRRRFQTAAELIDALVLLAEEVGLAPARLGPPGWVVPRRPKLRFLQRHVPWMVPLALLVAMVLGLQYFCPPLGESGDGTALLIPMPDEPAAIGVEPRDSRTAEKNPPQPLTRPSEAPLPPESPEKTANGGGSSGNTAGSPAGKVDQSAAKKVAGPSSGDPVPSKAPRTDKGSGPPDVTPSKPVGTAGPEGATLHPGAAEGGLSLSDPAAAGLLTVSQPQADRGELTIAAAGSLPPIPPIAPATGEAAKGPASGVLIVDASGGRPNRFATLEAACRAAANNDVIELRFNGPSRERPIALGNVKLTIRAGKGFRPVVTFRPSETDPVQSGRAMLTLTGSQLALVEVLLELVVPRDVPADSWSLFEIRQAEMTRLEKCVLTIRNAAEDQGAYHQDAAFFRVKAAPGADTAGPLESAGAHVPEPVPTPPVAISLSDCVVRGEAVVLRVQHARALRLAWVNGLLATSERLLVADGSPQAAGPGETLKIDLQHVTAVVRSGLCRFVRNESAPRQMPAQLSVSSSILVGSPSAPLVEQSGVSAADPYRQRLLWSGDRNFYEGFTVFWNVQFANAETAPETMTFGAWKAHWGPEQEIRPVANQVQWSQLPAADRPLHTDGPADYALSPSSPAMPNPALGSANDGRDAGAQLDRLPEVPPLSPEPEVASPLDK